MPVKAAGKAVSKDRIRGEGGVRGNSGKCIWYLDSSDIKDDMNLTQAPEKPSHVQTLPSQFV